MLSHFHSDHTGGLTELFDHGLIITPRLTKTLVVDLLKVKETLIRGLDVGKVYELADLVHVSAQVSASAVSKGASNPLRHLRVAFLDADHCPGAGIFFAWDVQSKQCMVHCGDCR